MNGLLVLVSQCIYCTSRPVNTSLGAYFQNQFIRPLISQTLSRSATIYYNYYKNQSSATRNRVPLVFFFVIYRGNTHPSSVKNSTVLLLRFLKYSLMTNGQTAEL